MMDKEITAAEAQADEKERAALEMNTIAQLRRFEPFRDYYLPRLQQKLEAHRRKILDPRTSDADTIIEKKILAAMESDLKFLDENETGCRNLVG